MSSFEPDDGLDALLRESMRGAADTVMPSGDGLSRIQQRVSARRARQRWLRPAMALGSAALVGLVAVGTYAVVHNNGTDTIKTPVATQPPTVTPTVEPTPTQTSPAPPAVAFPKRAIFPFVSAGDERAWEQAAASSSGDWHGDPQQVALSWVTNILQVPSLRVTRQISTPSNVDVVMGRDQTDGNSTRSITVTTVHLVKYGKAWIVTGATDDSRLLRIGAPSPGAKVSSPLVASGPGGGVDRAASVQVRDAVTPASYGEGHTGSFGVRGWSADVTFSAPTGPVGVLLVVENSSADGLPSRVVAQQVRFGPSSIVAGSQYFYGIKNGRVTKFAASNGAALTYLTQQQPGGPESDPQLVGSDVYFIRSIGPCGGGLLKVPADASNGAPGAQQVASPDSGYAISGYAVSNASRYAYYEQACNSTTSPQARLVFVDTVNDTRSTTRRIDFQGQPPMIVADPSFEPMIGSTAYLDAIVQTGTARYIARYDEFGTTTPTPSRRACPGYDPNNGRPWALETDANGTVWFATQTGSSMQVVRCAAGSQTAIVAFTVPGNRQPKDLDVSPDGSALLTDSAGTIWRWDGSGDAHQLSPRQPVTDVTW